jgi:hypothetical protein
VRFEWLDFEREEVAIRKGRNPRSGGLETTPKTRPRIVDCSYDPAIFEALRRLQKRSLELGQRDYVFTDKAERPLSPGVATQEGLAADASRSRAARAGQYSIRDTFISLALSAGGDPGWVAKVCGTSEQLIFQSYRKWMPSQRRTDGQGIARALGTPSDGHQMGTKKTIRAGKPGKSGGLGWRRGELNRRWSRAINDQKRSILQIIPSFPLRHPIWQLSPKRPSKTLQRPENSERFRSRDRSALLDTGTDGLGSSRLVIPLTWACPAYRISNPSE